MSKKMCFTIFVIALIVILMSFVLKFAPVTREVNAVFAQMCNIYLALSAIIISLILAKTKHYWLTMIALALLTAAVIQVVVLGGALMSVALLYKFIAFLVYVYIITLIRYMF